MQPLQHLRLLYESRKTLQSIYIKSHTKLDLVGLLSGVHDRTFPSPMSSAIRPTHPSPRISVRSLLSVAITAFRAVATASPPDGNSTLHLSTRPAREVTVAKHTPEHQDPARLHAAANSPTDTLIR